MQFPCGIWTAKWVQQKHLAEIWAILDQIPIQNHSWDTGGRIDANILHVSYWCCKGNHISFSCSLHVFHINIQGYPLPIDKYAVSGWYGFSFTELLVHYAISVKVLNWLWLHSFITSDGVTPREIVSWLMKTNSNIQEVKGSKHQKSGFHFFWKSSGRDCRVAW